MSYHLTLEEHPGYLHASVTGTHSPENMARFLREVREACIQRKVSAILLEIRFSGPSLGAGDIFGVISEGSEGARMFRKIAYVDSSERDPGKMKFAETVAINRGANVRLFRDSSEAKLWLAQ